MICEASVSKKSKHVLRNSIRVAYDFNSAEVAWLPTNSLRIGPRSNGLVGMITKISRPLAVIVAVSASFLCGQAKAQAPVAVVEEVAGTPGVEFMDYVSLGQTLKLTSHDSIVLSYIRSCWREKIHGEGTVTIGADQSTVEGGKIEREKAACEGGKMELAAAQSKQSAAMVFRGGAPPKPQFSIYSLSPVFEVSGGGAFSVERVDKAGERIELRPGPGELVHGRFYDLAKAGKMLQAGGVYRAKAGNQQVVFQVDPGAKTSSGPLVGRLVSIRPTS